MRNSRFAQRNDGSVLMEVIIASVAFVIIALLAADIVLQRNKAPVVELQTDIAPPRLVEGQ